MKVIHRFYRMLRAPLALTLLFVFTGCLTAIVEEDLWQPDTFQSEPVEDAVLDVEEVALDESGRLHIRARVAPVADASAPARERSQLRVYCTQPNFAQAGSDGNFYAAGEGQAPPGPRTKLNSGDVCLEPSSFPFAQTRSFRRLPTGSGSPRYFPDLGLALNLEFPQLKERFFRVAGEFDAEPYRQKEVEAYLRRFSNYDRNELYFVVKATGDYLRLSFDCYAGVWTIKATGDDFYEGHVESLELEPQTLTRMPAGPVVLVRRENLNWEISGATVRETSGVYAGVLEASAGEIPTGSSIAGAGLIFDVILISAVNSQSEFYPGHFFLNALAVPLFPLAVVADVILAPVYFLHAGCIAGDAAAGIGGDAAEGLTRSCLK